MLTVQMPHYSHMLYHMNAYYVHIHWHLPICSAIRMPFSQCLLVNSHRPFIYIPFIFLPYSKSVYGHYSLYLLIIVGLTVPSQKLTTKKCVHAPPVNPTLLQNNVPTFSNSVIEILGTGLDRYIPIHLSTPCSCLMLNAADDDVILIPSIHGMSFHCPHLNAMPEKSLLEHQWIQAARNMLVAMHQHLVSEHKMYIIEQYTSHFDGIQGQYDFHENFNVYLIYDCEIREKWVSQSDSFDIGIFQREIYTRLRDINITNIVSALSKSSNRDFPPCHNGTASAPPYLSNNHNTPCPLSDMSSLAFTTNTSLPSQKQSFRITSPPKKCIICGSPEHGHHNCTSTTLFIRKDAKGTWHTPSNDCICFTFNLGSICHALPNCPNSHICLRCSSSHTAQSCPHT
jgi:hypothetical protein